MSRLPSCVKAQIPGWADFSEMGKVSFSWAVTTSNSLMAVLWPLASYDVAAMLALSGENLAELLPSSSARYVLPLTSQRLVARGGLPFPSQGSISVVRKLEPSGERLIHKIYRGGVCLYVSRSSPVARSQARMPPSNSRRVSFLPSFSILENLDLLRHE